MNPDRQYKRTASQQMDDRLEYAVARASDAFREVQVLKRQFSQFTTLVTQQFGETFFKPWLLEAMNRLDIPESLRPGQNPLDITDFHPELKK
ncbi:hypothetical protein ACFLV4_07355 [Chloroflexota bacterium]